MNQPIDWRDLAAVLFGCLLFFAGVWLLLLVY